MCVVCVHSPPSTIEAPINAEQSSALSRSLGGPKAQLSFFSHPLLKHAFTHTPPSLPPRSCGDSPLYGRDAAVGRGGFVTQRDRQSTNYWPTDDSYYPKVFRNGSLNWIYMCVDSRVLGTGNGMDWGLGHWSSLREEERRPGGSWGGLRKFQPWCLKPHYHDQQYSSYSTSKWVQWVSRSWLNVFKFLTNDSVGIRSVFCIGGWTKLRCWIGQRWIGLSFASATQTPVSQAKSLAELLREGLMCF